MASGIYHEPYETILEWTKGKATHSPDANLTLKKKYKTYRNVGKTAVLQLGYYAGVDRFAVFLHQQGLMLVPTEAEYLREAARVVNVYRERNSRIVAFWKRCDMVLKYMTSGTKKAAPTPFGNGTAKGPFFLCNPCYDLFGRPTPAILLPDGFRLCTRICAGRRKAISMTLWIWVN